ncbi:MAG: hypothetical protein KGJ86_13245 [Chloroflexota bacterium]|nr:hypothetical protein [Chloroflexota bacterium]
MGNVPVGPGGGGPSSAARVATDSIPQYDGAGTTYEYQWVKLSNGTPGDATPLGTQSNPLNVEDIGQNQLLILAKLRRIAFVLEQMNGIGPLNEGDFI